MFLTALPLLAVFVLAIVFNDKAEGFVKLYPLIIISAAGAIFIFIYLMRVISISTDEIRIIGPFSSKDSAIINKGKTLIISQRKKKRLKVILFGNDGARPSLDWTQGENFVPVDINLFKEIGYGGERSIRRLLGYLEIDENTIGELIESTEYSKLLPLYELKKTTADNKFEYRITFLETI